MSQEPDRPSEFVLEREPSPLEQQDLFVESIVGDDNRVRIKNTREFPWRCHCFLDIRFPDGSSDKGTGFLIGRRTLLTAGHCVFSHRHGGGVAAVRVTPGRDDQIEPFGSAGAVRFASVDGWIRDMNPAFDYGVLFLPRDFIPANMGALACNALDDQQLTGLGINIAGYPAEERGRLLWHGGTIARLAPRFLGYAVDTTPGQSGAPVWTVVNQRAVVVGIHISGPEGENVAVRITDSVLGTIDTWREQGEGSG